jgi:hypothetical protein
MPLKTSPTELVVWVDKVATVGECVYTWVEETQEVCPFEEATMPLNTSPIEFVT